MKNKKGFLLAEETLKIIIAVIVLGFLAYLLFSIYRTNNESKELGLAKESVGFVEKELAAGSKEIQVYNPEGWTLTAWPNGGQPLLKCSNLGWQKCICICNGDDSESCNSQGACIENKQGFSMPNIEINNPPVTLGVNIQNKIIAKK